MTGERRRRRRARQAAVQGDATSASAGGSSSGGRSGARSGWRATIDSFGGFLTVGVVAGVVLVVVALIIASYNEVSSDESSDELLGEARVSSSARHIPGDDPAQVEAPPGEPPTGGPHFNDPQLPRIYDVPINDGNAIHALEHGIVWISYHPDLVDEETLRVLRDVADAFSNDTMLSPRPQNAMPIALASWERLLTMSSLNEELAREFIRTNRNRSPEPGVR
jgi:hypothetical protein